MADSPNDGAPAPPAPAPDASAPNASAPGAAAPRAPAPEAPASGRGQIVGASIFGALLVGILFYMFLFGQNVRGLPYNIASVFAALCTGLLAYFIGGSLAAQGTLPHRLGGLKVEAAGGMAGFLLVLLLFVLNQPGEGRTIRGFVFTGTPEAQGDPAIGATVKLVGEHPAETRTGDGGFFSFPDVRVSNPQLVFEMPGFKQTAPQPVAKEEKYYLRLPPKIEWKRVKDADLSLEPRPPGGGPDRVYVLKPRIKRTSEPPEYDGLDLSVSLNGNAVFAGVPDISEDVFASDAEGADQAGWLLKLDDSEAITPTITMRVRGRPGSAPLRKEQLRVRYRFRAIPNLPGG